MDWLEHHVGQLLVVPGSLHQMAPASHWKAPQVPHAASTGWLSMPQPPHTFGAQASGPAVAAPSGSPVASPPSIASTLAPKLSPHPSLFSAEPVSPAPSLVASELSFAAASADGDIRSGQGLQMTTFPGCSEAASSATLASGPAGLAVKSGPLHPVARAKQPTQAVRKSLRAEVDLGFLGRIRERDSAWVFIGKSCLHVLIGRFVPLVA